ncbi:hypothetical protein BDV32DRAFT_154704 [Aspergillus pseudonomiae]|uniref:Uncharacterized protein n=1 Tax=Aspergillus pseudonomiae TaxID=1506151 RepID=A0A5N6HQE5_9EURO|nr:uncharacterized protein BDV37DRAFT_278352 [Aspergillus pseudonomiae]KAB8254963.1 hypothetical protein BDV32DRAFT_154704 [Aspergillus pseudonomiae]KAE8409401.1 hypothetical protein BDV37DRAFT_278352 [Aspergillus pseudonomiae]
MSISELVVKTTAVNEESGYHMSRILLDLTKQGMAAKGQDHDTTKSKHQHRQDPKEQAQKPTYLHFLDKFLHNTPLSPPIDHILDSDILGRLTTTSKPRSRAEFRQSPNNPPDDPTHIKGSAMSPSEQRCSVRPATITQLLPFIIASPLTLPPSLAITNLAANTLGRWVDQNAAHWLNHIMLAVNFIVLASIAVREARRSTGDPGVIRTGGDHQTGLGEKESLVDAGKE